MPPPNTMRGICGGEALGQVPSESTFSRAFDPFSSDNRPQAIHEALIKTHYGEKIAGHISRDATAIHAREKATAKPQEKTSQSKKGCWCGYKLHLDVIDGDIPVSAILTSASLHVSQVAVPLAQMSAGRIVNLYDLADAAYDAKEIREMAARLGHVAIIDDNPGRGEKREFSPTEAVRYRERSAVERVNSHLHEQHGGRHVHVRGPAKVAAHLAFGLVVVAAEQMLRMLG